jgi:hypothetical protein
MKSDPRYSLKGRNWHEKTEKGPDPGSYNINDENSSVKKSAPKYKFGSGP